MVRKVGHTIHDLLETMSRLQAKVAGKSFVEFEADWELRFIVERAIEVISEATRRLPADVKALRPEIRWKSVAGIGNVLRHEYHTISNKVIWDVIHEEIPLLKAAVEGIAATLKE